MRVSGGSSSVCSAKFCLRNMYCLGFLTTGAPPHTWPPRIKLDHGLCFHIMCATCFIPDCKFLSFYISTGV